MGVNSERKEFAPFGANSFHYELTLLFEKSTVHKGELEVTKHKSYLLCKNGGKMYTCTCTHTAEVIKVWVKNTLMCLSNGTPITICLPFFPNGKLMPFRCPNI